MEDTAYVLKLFNDWFDVFNSNLKYGHHSGLHAYGTNIEEQNKILSEMNAFIKEMRVGTRRALLTFQKGILLCNASLRQILPYIQNTYSSEQLEINYILTRRLNQDILENFFAYLRSMGGSYDHPTPVELRNRVKWYILGRHSGHFLSPQENTMGDSNSTMFIDLEDIRSLEDDLLENENIWEDDEIMKLSHVELTHVDNNEILKERDENIIEAEGKRTSQK